MYTINRRFPCPMQASGTSVVLAAVRDKLVALTDVFTGMWKVLFWDRIWWTTYLSVLSLILTNFNSRSCFAHTGVCGGAFLYRSCGRCLLADISYLVLARTLILNPI